MAAFLETKYTIGVVLDTNALQLVLSYVVSSIVMKIKKYTLTANMLGCKTQSILGEMWQEACEKGRNLRFKIVSGGMSPVIEVGNIVRVSRAKPSRIRIGDVVTFRDGQSVVVHRLIGKISSNAQLTVRHRGDASASSGTIAAQNLIGRVTVIEKEGHKIRLDSRRQIMSNIILGWRLRLLDSLGRMQHRHISIVLHQALRP